MVPTWNYSAVHLRGVVRVIDDPEWVRGVVTALTDHHEGTRAKPWAVRTRRRGTSTGSCAPSSASLVVESVEGKAKLSQNRSAEDLAGVIAGLPGTPGEPVARAMEALGSAADP